MNTKPQLVQTINVYARAPLAFLDQPKNVFEIEQLLRRQHRRGLNLPRTLRNALQRLDTSIIQLLNQNRVGVWRCLPTLLSTAEAVKDKSLPTRGVLGTLIRWANTPVSGERFLEALLQTPGHRALKLQILRELFGVGKQDPQNAGSYLFIDVEQERTQQLLKKLARFMFEERTFLSLTLPESNTGVKVLRWPCLPGVVERVKAFEERELRPLYVRSQLPIKRVSWQILPSERGLTHEVLANYVRQVVGARPTADKDEIESRINYLVGLGPIQVWHGKVLESSGGIYVAYEFEKVVVAEAISLGSNAIYVAGNDEQRSWQAILGQTKPVARELGAKRIIHDRRKGWQARVARYLERGL